MKTRFKRLSKSTISVLLALMMVISTVAVGVVTTTAAFTDTQDSVGAKSEDTVGAKAAEDNDEVGANISDDGNVGITGTVKFHYWKENQNPVDVDLSVMGTYYDVITTDDSNVRYCFGLKVGDDYYDNSENLNDNDSIGDGRNYLWMNHNTHYGDAYVYLDKNSTYQVCYNQLDDGNGKIQINIRKKVTASTWTVVGDSEAIFGSAWAPTATANDMTLTSGTTYTWSKKGVSLTAGIYQFKVAQNHSWDYTSYPNDNVQRTLSQNGEYDVTVTFDSDTKAVNVNLQLITKSTLTLQNHEHAVIKAIYNGTSITGGTTGNTISDIPENATINIIVTPDEGYKCTGLTTNPTGATVTATSGTYTLTMPNHSVTVSPAIQQVEMKKVYFNNNPTMYNQVYAYAYSSTDSSRKPLGPVPGTIMTRMPNSNIWVITVPNDCDKITFTGEQGKVEGETVPWNDNTKDPPMYTPGTNTASPSTNGSWGKYIARDNEYIVSKGSTLENKAGLFTGINATFYDYYVDGEIGSTNGGWLNGIRSDEYNMGTGWKDDPYTRLNTELANYATKYGVGVPLYFGNLKTASYTNFQKNPNNSEDVGNDGHNAVTGLTGQTLANSNIHYYKSGATDENGAVMAMFDEDFLSGANNSNTTLATILRSAAFPVRKETVNTVYLNLDGKTVPSGKNVYVHAWKDASNSADIEGTKNGDIYSFALPYGYTNYLFYFAAARTGADWENYQTADCALTDGNLFTVSEIKTDGEKRIKGSKSASTATNTTHEYYEYDSTGGKDNVFITDISKTAGQKGQAQINYYDEPSMAVKSNSGKEGFFPFDYNNIVNEKGTIYLDLTTSGSGGQSYWAHFYTGSDVIDVMMEKIGDSDIYKVGIPGNYANVIFTKNADQSAPSGSWGETGSNVWNYTDQKDVPAIGATNRTFKITDYSGAVMNGSWITAGSVSGNGYADATNHYAHDQGFGAKLEIPFTLRENGLNEDGSAQVFEFSGDDDLWVYIDGKLVLDLGGAHARTTGTINFNTKTITNTTTIPMTAGVTRNSTFEIGTTAADVNTPHTMTIYYMERGMFDSNLKFGFSFHAIPNQFKVEKDIKTRNINSGFYTVTDDNKSNMTIKTKRDTDDRYITLFEKSYQTQAFVIEHRIGDSPALISGKQYTLTRNNNPIIAGTAAAQISATSDGTYNVYNDSTAYFVGNFTKGTKFNLKESENTGQLKYETDLNVTDEANNSEPLPVTGNNTDGYQFNYAETHSTGIDNLNILATFVNTMKSHTLTLTKALSGTTGDANTDFTFEILFNFGEGSYKPYPLSCTVDGSDSVLGNDGRITIKAGQLIEIPKIPENALIQVTEIFADAENSEYAYTGATIKTVSGGDVTKTSITNGVTFYLPADDTNIIINNNKGTLTVSHNLLTGSVGAADCFVTVDVQNNENASIHNYGQKKGEIVVDSKYIKPGSSDKLVIKIDTVPSSNYIVKEFYESIVDMKALAASGTASYTADINKNNKTATITVPISALFDANGQLYKYLPFYSELSLPEYKYEITYNFASRKLIQNGKLSDNRLWGSQFYKHKGTFTEDEVTEYIDLTSTPTFKTDKTAAYLAEHSPYEKNFLENIVWDFNNKTITYDPDTRTFSCSLTASQYTNTKINATFKLPFEYTLNTKTANAYTFSADDNVYKDYTTVAQHESVEMDFLDWFSLNDVKNKTQMTAEKQPEFLKVPDVLYDTTHTKKRTFMYWEFYKEGDVIGTAEPYQKCYSSALNQAVYQNTIFYPKYTAELAMDAQESKLVANAKTATITFLGVTRDQWNYNGGGADAYEIWHSKFADRIFTDFVMSFQYENKLIDTLGKNYKTGLIIQTLEPSGEIASETPEKLAAKYTSDDGKDNAIAKIKATDADISESGVNKYLISYNQQPLDDRNAIEYYYGIANVSQSTNPNNDTYTNVTTRRNYGYRAYSFIKKGTGTNAEVIISDPVYFTIYNVASITSGAN